MSRYFSDKEVLEIGLRTHVALPEEGSTLVEVELEGYEPQSVRRTADISDRVFYLQAEIQITRSPIKGKAEYQVLETRPGYVKIRRVQ